MRFTLLFIPFFTLLPALAAAEEAPVPVPNSADTTIVMDKVQVSAIKQGMQLRAQPVASTIVGAQAVERNRINSLKDLSQIVPNFYQPDYGSRMTSSIYVRGMGARIDQPVIGLNIDNVPVLNKNDYDMEMADVERIEFIRGPQSMLYGRNTMCGVVNVYTLSPLQYQGVRLMAEYGNGNSYKFRAAAYNKIGDNLGFSAAGYYTHTGGFFDNLSTGKKCDWERMGGGQWKVQWLNPNNGLRIDNTLAFSILTQGGYPYAYVGNDILGSDGQPIIRSGQISYNDPCGYKRTAVSDGLTIRYDAAKFSVSSITSYQYTDDDMHMDQDFLPLSYFTLEQHTVEHNLTEDVVLRSHDDHAYRWLVGAFGFYRHSKMDAPVDFKQTGIDSLILKNANLYDPGYNYQWGSDHLFLGDKFTMPSYGGAIYHESNYVTGKWHFTVGLRLDVEHDELQFRNFTDPVAYTKISKTDGTQYPLSIQIDNRNTLRKTFVQLLPKFSALYAFDDLRNLYISVAKGYKAGGFNTQIFSDVLQQAMMNQMGIGTLYDTSKGIAYDPEYSWNYEFGGHFSCMDGAIRGDFDLFYIDCRHQQLTVFPPGKTTGRMMTNAGRTRSYGAEIAIEASPWRSLDLNVAYGYTNAKFLRYTTTDEDAAGQPFEANYRGNRVPYAPENTLSAGAVWTIPTGVSWLGNVVLQADVRCVGRIWWNEQNSLSQPFYALADASARLEHKHYSLTLWCRNFAGADYNVFYFKSIGNEFVQRGLPRTFGVTLNLYL